MSLTPRLSGATIKSQTVRAAQGRNLPFPRLDSPMFPRIGIQMQTLGAFSGPLLRAPLLSRSTGAARPGWPGQEARFSSFSWVRLWAPRSLTGKKSPTSWVRFLFLGEGICDSGIIPGEPQAAFVVGGMGCVQS